MRVICEGGPCDGKEVEVEDGVTEFVCPKLDPVTDPPPSIVDPEPRCCTRIASRAKGGQATWDVRRPRRAGAPRAVERPLSSHPEMVA
jgi:hypothetical protein